MWPFSKRSNPQAAESAATEALRCQTVDLTVRCAKAGRDMAEILESPATLLLLFGFVDYFARNHGVVRRPERVNLAVSVFRSVFGDVQGIRMFGALEAAMRNRSKPDVLALCREGFNAAREFDQNGLKLVSAFLGGTLGASKLWSE
jgi:hypothetical protein